MTRLRWLLAIGLLLAPTPARAQSEEVIYYHTDAVGSVRMTTDATGAVVARYDYAPFGEEWPQTPPNTNPDVRQYAGKERDAETALDYFGARYYRAQSGRFSTVDPLLNIEATLTDPQRWNRYAHVRNNPSAYVDPDGRDIYLAQSPLRQQFYSAMAQLRASISGMFGSPDPNASSFERISFGVADALLSAITPTSDAESLQMSLGGVFQSGGSTAAPGVVSMINRDKGLVRLAEEAGGSVQSGIDALTRQLSQGNLNPGIGTKHLFGNVSYARARDGARVFFRQVGDTIEILAKSSKQNEERVIRTLQELYR